MNERYLSSHDVDPTQSSLTHELILIEYAAHALQAVVVVIDNDRQIRLVFHGRFSGIHASDGFVETNFEREIDRCFLFSSFSLLLNEFGQHVGLMVCELLDKNTRRSVHPWESLAHFVVIEMSLFRSGQQGRIDVLIVQA